MNLYQLELFVAVIEERSFRAAGQRLHLSPSALLRQIRSLESDLGVELFIASGQGVRVTREGSLLADSARHILSEARKMRGLAQSLKNGISGRVAIACHAMHVTRFLAVAERLFNEQYPDIEVALIELPEVPPTRPYEFDDLINHPEIDLAMTVRESQEFDSLPIWTTSLVAVVPDAHALRDAKTASIADFANKPVFALQLGAWSRDSLDELAKDAGISLGVDVPPYTEGIAATARAGFGVAVMADDCLHETPIRPYPKLVDLSGLPRSVDVSLVSLKSRTLSPAAATFLDFVRRSKSQIERRVSQIL